ncbi:hypothetical protein MNBD_GAMMA16-792 [hydrothermal vent metagenome]|uniref:Uncharacterized protein n=1 Tax=hydrothermal vent metagenome TaxID=652676 RepID=A0A3B0Z0U9_9ZZZZ
MLTNNRILILGVPIFPDKMPIGQLAEKLTRIANDMSVISDARKAL